MNTDTNYSQMDSHDVYRFTAKARGLIVTVAVLVIAGASFLAAYPFLGPEAPKIKLILNCLIISIPLIVFSFWYALDALIAKLTITPGEIIRRGIFGERRYYNIAIKGYKWHKNLSELHLFPKEGRGKIRISKYMEFYDDIESYIDINFIDLDDATIQVEKEEILADPEFGVGREERGEALEAARKAALVTNVAALLLCLWGFLKPVPHLVAITVLLVWQIIPFLVGYKYRGLLQFDEKKITAHPNLAVAMAGPPFVLGYRALSDWNLVNTHDIWMPVAILALVIFTLIMSIFRELREKSVVYLVLIMLISFVQSYGTIVNVNCIADHKAAQTEKVVILEKKKVKVKHRTTYNIYLKDWRDSDDPLKAKVTQTFYDSVQEQDSVSVNIYPGLIQMPWYQLNIPQENSM